MPEIATAAVLVMVPIGDIKPYHRNARENSVTVDKLIEIIPKVGFNQPLLLDRTNTIVKGHSRWKAAIRLGMKELPVVYTDADAETIKLDRIADNRIHEFSTWDAELLNSELGGLNLNFEFDLGSLDFSIDLGSFETAPAEQPSPPEGGEPAGNGAAAPQQPFITASDVARTVGSGLNAKNYVEVVCDGCGKHLWVERPKPAPRAKKGEEAATTPEPAQALAEPPQPEEAAA